MEDTLTLGRDLPRDEALVRKSMTQALTAHPAFAPLADHFRFQALVGAAAGQRGGGAMKAIVLDHLSKTYPGREGPPCGKCPSPWTRGRSSAF